MDIEIERVPIDSLDSDPENANKGTVRGASALSSSIEEHGFLDPGTLDRNGFIVGGNKRRDAAQSSGASEAIIVKAKDGSVPIYVQYDDLDLSDPDNKARRVAFDLNRIGQLP